MNTNACEDTHPYLEELLGLARAGKGTLVYMRVRKLGTARGFKGNKVIYGDDTVRVLLWTGIPHAGLLQQSWDQLNRQMTQGRFIEGLARETAGLHEDTTIADACIALQEFRDSLRRSMALPYVPGSPTSDRLWEPLLVDGVQVPGCRVYVGRGGDPEDDRAAQKGQLYITGCKLAQQVTDPAPNGMWRPNSKPKTVAKEILKSRLPIGLFCQYKLDPERVLQAPLVNKRAAAMARLHGLHPTVDAFSLLMQNG